MRKACVNCMYIDRVGEPCDSCDTNYSMFEPAPAPAPAPAPDLVNHPAHYEQSCSLECIQVMELVFGANAVRGFCLCNAFKYMWRYKNKNGLEDLKKAKWYLDYIKTDYIPCADQFEAMEELLDQLIKGCQAVNGWNRRDGERNEDT